MQTEINEVEVNGVKYIRKDSLQQQQFNGEVKIVILQRGWVYIGIFERTESGLCRLHKAQNIRIWGTTKGLCELVNGPTSATKLDKCEGAVEFDWLTVIHSISVDPKKWSL